MCRWPRSSFCCIQSIVEWCRGVNGKVHVYVQVDQHYNIIIFINVKVQSTKILYIKNRRTKNIKPQHYQFCFIDSCSTSQNRWICPNVWLSSFCQSELGIAFLLPNKQTKTQKNKQTLYQRVSSSKLNLFKNYLPRCLGGFLAFACTSFWNCFISSSF